MLRRRALSTTTQILLPCLGLFAACSSGSGPSSTRSEQDLTVADVSVASFEVVRLNQPIDITFNKDVDFSTVNANTIHIATPGGVTATGSFSLLADGRTVRFQPSCPTLDDNSDAGLRAGGLTYRLQVLGSNNSGVTVQTTTGEPLQVGFSVDFLTPASDNPQVLFLDTVGGAPAARLRGRDGVASDDPSATYLEFGGDSTNRVYFVWNGQSQKGELEGGMLAPLNFYSRPDQSVALLLSLNQPVNPASSNVNTQLVQLEYLNDDGEWASVPTRLSLEANCTETGSLLRLEPIGLLPQGREVRAIIRDGFGDLTGDKTILETTNIAHMTTETVYDPGTTNPGVGVDEVLEGFSSATREDRNAAFATPAADWGGGQLQASFPFGGTGGPNGNFDWYIPPGTDIFLDTTATTIVGGPGGDPTTTQQVVNGVVDVRNMWVPSTSSVVILGPNTCTILATGSVRIDGMVTVSGTSHEGVGTLNTTNQPEPGAAGNAGGGKGGTASYLTNQSTPRGGTGFGAFNTANGGGQGGETSYGTGGINIRRGAGGGGGTFGPNVLYSFGPGFTELTRCQELAGMDAEHGCGGGVSPGKGAESQTARAQGGVPAVRPFFDGDDENDFLGTMLTTDGRLVRGELEEVWAASGGGGGGDAVDSSTFPLIPFVNTGDEKGAGGGGGAGGLRILALGPILVRAPNGQILAHGGQGGGGENPSTGGFGRVGGGSGGGAGGHIVLSSASYISVEGNPDGAGEWYNDYLELGNWNDHLFRIVSAVGGQGGAGRGNKGGSPGNGNRTFWRCDAVPKEYFATSSGGGLTHNPPRDDNNVNACWASLGDVADPDNLGPTIGAGGDGGPGIVQMHVDQPDVNLRFPDITEGAQVYGAPGAAGIDVSKVVCPPPVGWRPAFANAASDIMIPFFGKESTAQSTWIALGLARIQPSSGSSQVEFFFQDTDPDDGSVLRDGESQALRSPVLGPVALASEPNLPFIDASDPLVITMDGSTLAPEDEIYKRNAQLLRLFVLRLEDSADAANALEFDVASASYDPALDQLRLTVFPTADEQDLHDLLAAEVLVSLTPLALRVQTNGHLYEYPEDSTISISFQGTTADAEGNPSEVLASDLVTDITELNTADYDFFRFRVHFNLSNSGNEVNAETPRPALDYLRIPFRF